jgi:hypothetical protein
MGIEFREGSLTITPTCHAVATKGMIFNVNIGFSGIVNKEASDSKGKEVALFIGDTILVSLGYHRRGSLPSSKPLFICLSVSPQNTLDPEAGALLKTKIG